MKAGSRLPALAFAVALALGSLAACQAQPANLQQRLFDLTGEERLPAQLRGLGHLSSDLIRPRLDLQPETPIAHNGVNPFGINTFLQQEVEPAKRQRQVVLIAEAGFHWLRQEFPWYDLEISRKGNFEDCRHGACISAWDKYDHIVDLAEDHGLELLVRLSSPPDWSRADGAARGPFAPPDNFDDFADYAAAVAERYRGRIRYYQVWNEPNIYNEWGDQPVDPEAYTRLLCTTYRRLKHLDPSLVVVSGVLAPTIELGSLNDFGGNNLNDFIFLERMYAAGAAACFDVMSVQGYGLYSGPTDRRNRPIIVNYGRNQFIRDIMVRHGDAHKAIWIAEMNWNAVPAGSGIFPHYGQVTEAQQARYAPLAYQRAQQEWPWVGVNFFWFFKRADDSERNQAWYYFRMAEPDFTLLPVYHAMRAYTRQTPVMNPGWFQEDHWAVQWQGAWASVADARATLGAYQSGAAGASLAFTFDGSDLILVVFPAADGQLQVQVDGGAAARYELRAAHGEPAVQYLSVARGLPAGRHHVEITAIAGRAGVDGFIVRHAPNRTGPLLAALLLVFGAAWLAGQRLSTGRP
jgi:polysaccharide biosynthesis protein PslG